MADDFTAELEEAAKGPAEARDDEGAMKSHPLPDLIAADEHARRTAAAARTGLPIRRVKMRNPGTV